MNTEESPADFLGQAQLLNIPLHAGELKLEMIVKGQGAPLLFLHGMDGVESCSRIIDILARDFTVYAPSHPGFGASELPRSFSTIDDLAYFYLDLLEHLDLRNVTVVGFSLGGWIAAEILVKDASRVAKLVLGAPLGLRTAERRKMHVTDFFMLDPKQLDAVMQVTPVTEVNLSALSEPMLERIARNAEAVSLFGWSPYLYNPKLHLRLHRIKVPTVVLWGEDDRLAPLDYGRNFAAQLKRGRLQTLASCGHRIYVDSPAAAAETIVNFTAARANESRAH
ncbi:MAG TPA: alpha/beta hydrolase [Steroidobacter sp.]|uniref:alpha/beta fold hydrolase n=1 Tax=Steroidobacter sp. TaxID=1978227 RepID=UPI002EDB9B94